MNLEELKERIKSCSKCPELVKSRKQSVPGYGDSRAKVIFIGLAPGKDGADLTGVPFTRDPSGVLFQKMLIKIGLSVEEDPENEKPILRNSFVSNIAKCNPKTKSKCGRPINRDPNKKEVEYCLPYLREELSLINPKIIVPLGRKAALLILKEKGICSDITWNEKIEGKGAIVFPMYHPGFVIRGGGRQRYSEQDYERDFEKLKSIIKGV